MEIAYRWLGVAGLEFRAGDQTLLIDPFFTRPSWREALRGRPARSDAALVARYVTSCQHVLVSHAHYDHLLDVPEVLHLTGARAYGSPNTCRLLEVAGLPPERLVCAHPGDRLDLGVFQVQVLPAWHTRTPLDWRINGPLPPRLPAHPALLDFRMDESACFFLQVGAARILVGNYLFDEACAIPGADVVFLTPFVPLALLEKLLVRLTPRQVIPIHWDDFLRPLSQPLRPLPFKRVGLAEFTRRVQRVLPAAQVITPQLFNWETLVPS